MQDRIINMIRKPQSQPYRVAESGGRYEFKPKRTIPVVGYVAAGEESCPAYTDGDMPAGFGMLGEIDFEELLDPAAYAVKIRGDSMLPQYRDGDTIVVSPEATWHSGDHCLIRAHDGRVWAKRVVQRDRYYLLEPDNPSYEIIDLQVDDVEYIHKIIMSISR